MSTRNLEALFKPRRVALIGASGRKPSVGARLASNLLGGEFQGVVDLVNPAYRRLRGQPVFAEVSQLPEAPDLAVIATPPQTVPDLVAALARRGARAAVVISEGFDVASAQDGAALRQRMLNAARPTLLRIVGPACLGVLSPRQGLNASFSHLTPKSGGLAFVAQSGAVISAVIDWAEPRGIGFSHLLSLGEMADVDVGDVLDYLATDSDTQAILLYIEHLSAARKFMSAARSASRLKPVIAVKAGRYAAVDAGVESHCARLATRDAVYESALARAGVVRVQGMEDLFDAAAILSRRVTQRCSQLTILTNGSALGLLASDALLSQGGALASLPEDLQERLRAVLPAGWSGTNPIDIFGDADAERYARTLDILLSDVRTSTLLVLNSPTGIADAQATARAVASTAAEHTGKIMLASWVGARTAASARSWLATHGVPSYAGPAQAVSAYMHLQHYHAVQEELMETPPSLPEAFEPDQAAARLVVEKALAAGQGWLTPDQCAALMAAYRIPLVSGKLAASPQQAAELAAVFGGPVAVKLISPDVRHKSEAGGVLLNLDGAEAVRSATAAMLQRLRQAHPEWRLEGVLVQPMVNARHGLELIVGMADDPLFGPVIAFGHGGTAVDTIADTALALPPLNLQLARRLIARTRVSRLLAAQPGRAALDLDAVALVLVKLAQLVVDVPALRELDINPLLISPAGVVGLDARCRVRAAAVDRLSIRPYPRELEEAVTLPDGRRQRLRPIRPEDEPGLQAAFKRLSLEDIRLRFHYVMRQLPHSFAARLSQIDYDREMALVLVEEGAAVQSDIHGVIRLIADPDNEKAEFAIIVESSHRGQGLGRLMMRRILAYARGRGIAQVFGDVLAENRPMLELSRALGFALSRSPEDPGVVRVTLLLDQEKQA